MREMGAKNVVGVAASSRVDMITNEFTAMDD